MERLVRGVINFHQNVLPGLRGEFARLARGQSPDALMIACSDSRVAPNLFASTDPGDLFVVRNPGNLVPPANPNQEKPNGASEAAAIEIALEILKVRDIIICGHSHCAGMASLLSEKGIPPNLKQWIRHGEAARRQLSDGNVFDPSLPLEDQLSQLNVMSQLENLKTYPQVGNGLKIGALRVHGWWFDIGTGNVHAFDPGKNKFVIIDEDEGERILRRIES